MAEAFTLREQQGQCGRQSGDADRRRNTAAVINSREGKRIRFGSMLPDGRRYIVASALNRSLNGMLPTAVFVAHISATPPRF